MCSQFYCLRLPFFSRLPPPVTLNIRIAASRDKHSIHHGFSEELAKNFFFRFFVYDKHVLVNKFISKKKNALVCDQKITPTVPTE